MEEEAARRTGLMPELDLQAASPTEAPPGPCHGRIGRRQWRGYRVVSRAGPADVRVRTV